MSLKKLRFNIQLLSDSGTAGSDGNASGQSEANSGTESNSGVVKLPTSKRADKNPLSNVVYGKQEADNVQVADAQDNGNVDEGKQTDGKAKSFDDLIKDEYKQDFDKKVSEIVQKRLKNSKETVAKYESLLPTLELLASKYGVKADDIIALKKAIEADDTYYEAEATKRGLSVEQLKAVKKLEADSARLHQIEAEQQARSEAEKTYEAWIKQADKARAVYPNLDLKAEIENPDFVSLLRAGVDVEAAYTVIHRNEIIPTAMAAAAKTAERKVTNSVMANKSRPQENGLNSSASAVIKSDVSQLSKADRQEIARRVQRGEKITF